MKNGIIITGTIVSLVATGALAQDSQSNTNHLSYLDDGELFHANELSLDAFGGLTLGEHTIDHISGRQVVDNGRLGAGAGVNYYFTRYIGIGGDGFTENTAHNFVDNASGSLLLRLPLGHTGIAPYAFGGGGHIFDPRSANFVQFGGGLEFRVAHNFGIFADARYVIPHHLGDYGLGRAGFRFIF